MRFFDLIPRYRFCIFSFEPLNTPSDDCDTTAEIYRIIKERITIRKTDSKICKIFSSCLVSCRVILSLFPPVSGFGSRPA